MLFWERENWNPSWDLDLLETSNVLADILQLLKLFISRLQLPRSNGGCTRKLLSCRRLAPRVLLRSSKACRFVRLPRRDRVDIEDLQQQLVFEFSREEEQNICDRQLLREF